MGRTLTCRFLSSPGLRGFSWVCGRLQAPEAGGSSRGPCEPPPTPGPCSPAEAFQGAGSSQGGRAHSAPHTASSSVGFLALRKGSRSPRSSVAAQLPPAAGVPRSPALSLPPTPSAPRPPATVPAGRGGPRHLPPSAALRPASHCPGAGTGPCTTTPRPAGEQACSGVPTASDGLRSWFPSPRPDFVLRRLRWELSRMQVLNEPVKEKQPHGDACPSQHRYVLRPDGRLREGRWALRAAAGPVPGTRRGPRAVL